MKHLDTLTSFCNVTEIVTRWQIANHTPHRTPGILRGHYSCMASWTTASRHISGTHMEAQTSLPQKRSSVTREWSESHLSSNMHRTNHSTHAQRNDNKMWLTLCLDERFCNLSFGCLNSFVFICPGSQKTWPLITAWLLGEGGRGRRSPFYTFDKPETKFQRVKLMLMRLSSPT